MKSTLLSLRQLFLFCVLLAIVGIVNGAMHPAHHPKIVPPKEIVDIILSPHYDDAVLSLGGMIGVRTNQKIIATFFTSDPRGITPTEWDLASGFSNSLELVKARKQENLRAISHFDNTNLIDYTYSDFQYDTRTSSSSESIQEGLTADIQNLLGTYADAKVRIYGPSYFGPQITHPDHALLHSAFITVAKQNQNPDITFYLYEDFPYINRFVHKAPDIDFTQYLSKTDGITVDREIIPLTQIDIAKKKDALHEYSSQIRALSRGLTEDITFLESTFDQTRCSQDNPQPYACEVIYKIVK